MNRQTIPQALVIAFVLAAASLFGNCARVKPEPPKEAPAIVAPVSHEQQQLVPNSEYSTDSGRPRYRVWYGTNRMPVDPNDESQGYSHSRDQRLHYGRCYVEVPLSHQFGSVGSSWIVRLVTWTDDRLKLEDIEPMDATTFFGAALSKLLSRSPGERTVLVYIHGYNVTFEEAAIRAAQIGYDLKVEGITAFFSWPSQGTLAGYSADEATVQASEPYLREFVTRIARETGAERVDVIAHSMGNRALLRIAQDLAGQGIRLGQIILAAPDVDQQVFQGMAHAYRQISDRTTMYISDKDRALQASGIVHDYPRAGFFPPIMVLSNVDTIKVSNIDLTILGHGYFADAAAVLYDIYTLLRQNLSPDQRIRLRPSMDSQGAYWEIRP